MSYGNNKAGADFFQLKKGGEDLDTTKSQKV